VPIESQNSISGWPAGKSKLQRRGGLPDQCRRPSDAGAQGDFDQFFDDTPVAAVQVVANHFLLRFEPQN
jgi:hypothetical protein